MKKIGTATFFGQKKNKKRSLSLFFILLLICTTLCASEDFVYDRHGKRDPFIPLITDKPTGGIIGLMGVEGIDDIILEGIVWEEDGSSLAILNGTILKEGEEVGNLKLSEIKPTKITLIINKEEHIIELIKEEEENFYVEE